MPRLVLINGAPGSGKSTLARRYAQDHPLTLALDIDREKVRAEFVEVALLSSPDEAVDRFVRRSDRSTRTEHQDAAALLERSGGPDTLRDVYQQLLAVVAARPATRTGVTVDGEVDQAYADLLTRLAT